MKRLDLTFATPAENLACDEALLDLCENERVEILRFWESRQHFVVIGYGNQMDREVNVEECRVRGVPILRRCTGGGTVVQGPGCLNYSVTLRVEGAEPGRLGSVTGTNEFVMQRNQAALEKLLGIRVAVLGYTDLAYQVPVPPHPGPLPKGEGNIMPRLIGSTATATSPAFGFEPKTGTNSPSPEGEGRGEVHRDRWLKFSGNAQRRRRHAVLFHGTVLYGFDLSLIESLLRFPSAQPEYRASRPHTEFVRNVPVSAEAIRSALREAWKANTEFNAIPHEQIANLVRAQYANREWNLRR